MFYNITESIVEDFTGKGMSDLKNGIIRTPLDPVQVNYDIFYSYMDVYIICVLLLDLRR